MAEVLPLSEDELRGKGSEPFDVVVSMSGLGQFAEEVGNAVDVETGDLRLKVLPLERILVSKAAADRPKDRLVIPVLRNALRTLRVKRKKRRKKKPRPSG